METEHISLSQPLTSGQPKFAAIAQNETQNGRPENLGIFIGNHVQYWVQPLCMSIIQLGKDGNGLRIRLLNL
jgi:hypothetical protein